VVAADLPKLVFRAIFSCMNARYQLQSAMLSRVTRLRDGEVELAGVIGNLPTAILRASEYWSMRLDKAEGNTPQSTKKATAAPGTRLSGKPAKPPSKSSQSKQARGARAASSQGPAKGRRR
jgi:hypothetical protein